MTVGESPPKSDLDRCESTPQSSLDRISFGWLALLIVVGIFATGLPQPNVVGKIPFSNLLKNELHRNESQVSWFFFWVTVPWSVLKPVLGLVTDSFPIRRTKRRHYLLMSAGLSVLGWVAFPWVPHEYKALLIACFILNVFMALGSTVLGAVLVDAGRSMGALGRFTALRVGLQNVIGIIQGPLGGMFAVAGLSVMAGANAALLLGLIPIAYVILRERPAAVNNTTPFHHAGDQLRTFFRSRAVWLVLATMVLFYFAPNFGTVLFFRQQKLFGLSAQQIGWLTGIASAFGFLVAIAYPAICRRWSLRTILLGSIPILAVGNFAYLLYSTSFAADAAIEVQNTVLTTLCELVLYNLAARATPIGCEGMGYAFLVGFRNVCVLGSDVFGSVLTNHRLPFFLLLTINSGATLVVLALLPFFPAALARIKEGTGAVSSQA